MGEGSGDIGRDTSSITGEFEAPKFINDRSGAVRDAMRTGPSSDPVKVEVKVAPTPATPGASVPALSKPTQPAPKPVTMRDVLPNGLPPVFQSGPLPAFAMPNAPNVSSSDYSRTYNMTFKSGDLTVNGSQEPRQIGEIYKAAQGYNNSDTIRNLRPILT